MSKMNAKKAAKLDMDDRAKISQYFSRPVGGAGDIAGNDKIDFVTFCTSNSSLVLYYGI